MYYFLTLKYKRGVVKNEMIANVSYRRWKSHTRKAVIRKGHQIFFSTQKLIREGSLTEALQ